MSSSRWPSGVATSMTTSASSAAADARPKRVTARRERPARPREPGRAARVVDRKGDADGDEREDGVRRQAEIATDLAIQGDVLVLCSERRDDLRRDDRQERDEQRRRRDANAVAERDDDK